MLLWLCVLDDNKRCHSITNYYPKICQLICTAYKSTKCKSDNKAVDALFFTQFFYDGFVLWELV